MADYGGPESRYQGSRVPNYGGSGDHQRDAAFHNIFGGAPPPGRSHTMTTQPTNMYDGRLNSLNSGMQSQHTMSMRQGPPPPMRQMPQTYDRANGIAPGQPYINGTNSARPMPQNPGFPDRRAYPPPQRMDPRPGGGPPLPMPYDRSKPMPNRMPPPALNNDSYRSRSMVRPGEPTLGYRPPPSSFQQGTASAFRQQPYAAMGASRTTAQGRHIPDRIDDSRAMSMGSYALDRDHAQQLTSGRVVPGRRRESELDPFGDHASPSPDGSFTSSSSPAPSYGPSHQPRHRSEGNVPPRTVSSASAMSTTSVASGSSDMTGTTVDGSRSDSMVQRPPPSSNLSSSSQTTTTTAVPRKSPLVYPALLSRVASVFQERIGVGDRNKNDLSYKNAFTGAEAVDLIAYIIKTTDRNLALLLGRALDAQKFFHDVTYEHRLRDAPGEVYQFRETMGEEASSKDVNGVFTLLTECYSPTCTKDHLCYSIACPRRLEQQARLNLRPQPGLRHSNSRGSLHGDDDQEQKLWINSVPKEVADRIDDKEKKRQEVISELMYTERDFVKDLEYLRDFWIRPLRGHGSATSPIKEERREKFVRTVFGNCLEVLAVNGKFAEELSKRQKEQHVVHSIGDVFLKWVPQFDPFIKYGANQMYGKYEFEREKGANPAFSRFVDETERLKESRKLELNGYLTKPTTRLARYPLLLDNVLKYTKDDNPDKKDIPKAIGLIKDFLARVNAESGKAENHFNLLQLNQQLKWNALEYTDLKLTEENRVILTKMSFKKTPTDNAEVQVYLFDHAVLMCRVKVVNKRDELRVYRKPIPLELLVIAEMDQVIPRLGIAKRPSSSLIPGSKSSASSTPGQKDVYPITFRHLGKGAYELQLYATSITQRKKFIELVEAQQTKLRERSSNFYTKTILCEGFFNAQNRVNCLVPTDGGRKLVIGTDNGIYIADRWPKDKSIKPRRILDATQVSQIDTLEEYRLLLVLSNKTLTSYPFEALDATNQNPLATRPRKIQGHANFFKAGIGLGRHLVCSVKTSALSTTIKVYEPMDDLTKGKKKPAISKMFASGQDALKPFKEFYIPAESTSVHYLRSTLCVGCARGFEVVSLETTERQSLLDQADTSLDFVTRKENVKPIHIERLNGEFLLNYSDFSFFVNRNGWRARQDWKITWEGTPQAFALNYPYILAFEPSFIEIRHIETSELIHVMTGKNVRMLHSSTREILYAYEDETGEDVIASLDFWTQAQA
ncbi:rho guanine nucleotide exchange factor 4 [Exophiala viscosa]|uniref:rho guanine nucleotide exchange factor 4 n=1 Tax=Exophiala viscosa TaxID=2486360 RepID=UPI00219C7378|nr:rho guanine nucleotide exchange factor 4 [Exophiala viscosa]